jgi:hypothetical protein
MNRDTTSHAGSAFYVVTMTAALCIGALQMFRVRGGFITNYGADLVGTAWLYAMFRQGRTRIRRGYVMAPGTTAAFVFLACAASEFAQRFHFIGGTFDPWDLVAYAVSVVVCYGLDRRLAFVQPVAADRASRPQAPRP